MLNKIKNLFQKTNKPEYSNYEHEYLNESVDICDLENRMKNIQNSQSNNWYVPFNNPPPSL